MRSVKVKDPGPESPALGNPERGGYGYLFKGVLESRRSRLPFIRFQRIFTFLPGAEIDEINFSFGHRLSDHRTVVNKEECES